MFELTILGSSSATPAYNRNPSSQVLNLNEHYYLIDCGEATQNQLNRYKIKTVRIDYIFISHLHGDHYLGLVGLLSSMHLKGRTEAITIFGPPQLLEIIEIQLKYSETQLRYPFVFIPINAKKEEVILVNDEVSVRTVIMNHRIACTGFVFTEVKKKRKLRQDKILEYNIPVAQMNAIKEGANFEMEDGKFVFNADITIDSPEPRSYAYFSDTIFSPENARSIKGVDILYHEATFMHDLLDRAKETFHTTSLQAGEFAKLAGVKMLIVGHFSARYKELEPLLQECRSVFENSFLASEGTKFSI